MQYDPTERNPSSPEASYLASVLLSFYWADAPRFSAVTAAVLRRYALTAAVASLTLAIKVRLVPSYPCRSYLLVSRPTRQWLNDFTAPNYAVSLESFARHAPIQISPRQIIVRSCPSRPTNPRFLPAVSHTSQDAERSILRTSSLYYAIPTTPYDVLYELERAVTFLGAFKIERPEGWHELFTAFEEELRRASSSTSLPSALPSRAQAASQVNPSSPSRRRFSLSLHSSSLSAPSTPPLPFRRSTSRRPRSSRSSLSSLLWTKKTMSTGTGRKKLSGSKRPSSRGRGRCWG